MTGIPVWRLAFGVWRLALSPPQASSHPEIAWPLRGAKLQTSNAKLQTPKESAWPGN